MAYWCRRRRRQVPVAVDGVGDRFAWVGRVGRGVVGAGELSLFGWNHGPFEMMNLKFWLLAAPPEGGEDRRQAGVERAV
jgi:hypothetical protein